MFNYKILKCSVELDFEFSVTVDFLHQNIYAHVLHLRTFASIIYLKFLQFQTLND